MVPDIYNTLSLAVAEGKGAPGVWVRRLVIYERLQPEPVVVRDIPLTRGLNIVWAEESEDDSENGKITGHSAGKTTLCRLFRYCLGESTFGTATNQELIRRWLPDGYVAAELCIRDKQWSVLRPFGKGRHTAAKFNCTVEELVKDRGNWVGQDQLAEKLGLEHFLGDLPTSAILRTQQPIQWGQILAWCTRDQEARFQTVHEWRSPRSGSGTPSFEFPRADPLFVMRTVLGLFAPEELAREEKLAQAQKEVERQERLVDELRRAPDFRVSLYEGQLRQRLKALLPDERDVDNLPFQTEELLPSLSLLTDNAIGKLRKQHDDLELELAQLQDSIDAAGTEMGRLKEQKEQIEALFGVQKAGLGEIAADTESRENVRDTLAKAKDAQCVFGGVLFSECSYVQRRQQVLRMTELQDAHALEQAEAERAELQRKLEGESERLQADIREQSRIREDARKARTTAQRKRNAKQAETASLGELRDELARWITARDQSGTYTELDETRKKSADASGNVTTLTRELAELLSKHDAHRDLLASIFAASVRAVLPNGGHDGQVLFEGRDLAFRITSGPAMSGEAVETLSVLLADLTCLIYNSVSDQCHLPGFLLHDSPREADLATRLYRNFLRFAASLQNHFGSADACPFQYIITTTTPPPTELRVPEFVKLRLNAGEESELLLRRNIARTPRQTPRGDLLKLDMTVNGL